MTTISVPDMMCENCVKRITNALTAAELKFTVSLDTKTVTIDGCALHAPEVPLDGHNDHRVVMSLAVAALAAGVPATIRGANAVAKSWPDFFDAMRALGARVELEE